MGAYHVNFLFASLAVFVAGCAVVDPAQVKLSVLPTAYVCDMSGRKVPIYMMVHNGSRGKLKVWIDPVSDRSPYTISWLSYELLDERGEPDWKYFGGSHGPLPPLTLSIGPGDTTQLMVNLYDVTSSTGKRFFKIAFKDVDGHQFVTGAFKACTTT